MTSIGQYPFLLWPFLHSCLSLCYFLFVSQVKRRCFLVSPGEMHHSQENGWWLHCVTWLVEKSPAELGALKHVNECPGDRGMKVRCSWSTSMFAPNVLRAPLGLHWFWFCFFHHTPKKRFFCWLLQQKTWNLLNVRVDKVIEAPQKAEQEDRNDMDSNIESHCK